MVLIYNLLLTIVVLLGLPLFVGLLLAPRRRGMFMARLGWPRGHLGNVRPTAHNGRPIWIHALSVGEVLSAEPIIGRLLKENPDHPIVFSATTKSGMNTARQRFKGKVDAFVHFPYDLLFSVRRVIRHVDPSLVVIVETDIWPNFLWQLDRWRIPALLVNARLSDRSFHGYRRLGRLMGKTLSALDAIGTQTQPDAERFVRLGAPTDAVIVTGNVKFDQPIPGGNDGEGASLRRVLGVDLTRIIVIMGSTHPNEEEAGIQLLEAMPADSQPLLLIVVPRDPAKANMVAARFGEKGLRVGFLGELAYKDDYQNCDVLVVNAIGLLRQLYTIADIAFVGGSLVPEGGHNPLEPAAAGCPILFGPDMRDFKEIAGQLVAGGAAVQVTDTSGFCEQVGRFIADGSLRMTAGANAQRIFLENRGASRRIVAMIHEHLDRREGTIP